MNASQGSTFDSSWSSFGRPQLHTTGLPLLPNHMWTMIIAAYVTIVLSLVNDHLSWHTYSSLFVIMHRIKKIINDIILLLHCIVFLRLELSIQLMQVIVNGSDLITLFTLALLILYLRIYFVWYVIQIMLSILGNICKIISIVQVLCRDLI